MNSNVLIWLNRKHAALNNKDYFKADIQADGSKRRGFCSIQMALDFFAGCLGGIAGVLVGHPFDTVKVHLQTQDIKNPKYTGTFHCMKSILATESFRGLYRGITSPMLGIGFVNAIVFGVYGNVQRYSNDSNSLYGHLIAGALAGVLQSFVSAPMELAKTRVQLQHLNPTGIQHSGPLQCFRHIIATEGVRGSMKGLTLTVLRDVPGFSSYFVSYEYIMQLPEKPNALHNLLAGGIAGMCSWVFCYPIDVIKTCMQADIPGPNAQYKNVKDCIQKGYKSDGLRFFLRGINSTMIRAFPMNAATFFVVSLVMRFAKCNNVDLVVNSSNSLTIYSLESQHSCKDRINEQTVAVDELKKNDTQNSYADEVSSMNASQANVQQIYLNSINNNNKYYVFEDERLLQDKIEC